MNARTSKLITKAAKLVGQTGKALKKLWKQTHPNARVLFRNDMKAFVANKLSEKAATPAVVEVVTKQDPYQTPPVYVPKEEVVEEA